MKDSDRLADSSLEMVREISNVYRSAPQISVNSLTEKAEPSLRSYTRRKLAIAAQLRALLDLLKQRGSETRFHRCEELMVKLAEDRFTLAVVGQFKRGKSSLMNAIIGRALLPTGVLPLTSAITVLKFGPAERLIVRLENSVFPEIVPVSALANYVTEKGNPGNRKKVKTATVEVPIPFLRRGLEFVDTPGVGSAIQANSATTYGFLPECDAVLFVTGVDSPFTETELDFLHAIREHVAKIFFILNKTDLLRDEAERAEVLKFVEAEVRAEMQTRRARIFPLSAKRALTNNSSGSGLDELQETLAKFLAEEKSAVFLSAIIERALRLLDDETGDLKLHHRASELPKEVARERLETLRKKWNDLAAAREKLLAQFRDGALEKARRLTSQGLDRLLPAEKERLTRDLDRLIAAAGWSLGEEVAQRWRKLSSTHLRKAAAQWLRDLTSQLESATEPDRMARQALEENLRQIPVVAGEAFGLESSPSEEVLPSFGERAAFDQRLESLQATNSLGWFSFLPARFIRPSLKRALHEQTQRFIQQWREQIVSMIDDSVRRMNERRAEKVNAVAIASQSRLTAAITGERSTHTEWRQSTVPIRDAGWGDEKLLAIRNQLLALRDNSPRVDQTEPELRILPPNEESARFETREINLSRDLKTRGCAVCDHLIKTAFDFLAHWQYAISSDEKAQKQFAQEQGFCALHMWQLHAVSSTLGESIGLARLIEQTAEALKRDSLPPNRTQDDCRVCQLVRQSATDYIERLAAFVSEEVGHEAYACSQGVCLRHLAALLPHVSNQVGQFLRQEAARHFDETAEEMQSYAMKHEAVRRTLENRDEADAHLRALIHLAGAKDVSTPWPEDREI